MSGNESRGWVQSYGSRCVRPPILYGDVSRPAQMTVSWARYVQSLTAKPVKGMLTGPVTILAWSFVRDDQSLGETARQVAPAIRDEVHDLEAAGIRVGQVDEPALRELLPLDADVTSIEAARSKMEVLTDLDEGGFGRGVGPRVYDIHTPRVPPFSRVAKGSCPSP